MRRFNARHACLILIVLLGGCSREQSTNSPQTTLPRSTLVLKGKTFNVQIASTNETREKGYMFTNRIPDDEGMVFCFRQPRGLQFWNHNVPIPLDLVFVRPDGTVDAIHTMPALVEDTFQSQTTQAQYALEFKAGTIVGLGVRPGDKVELSPAIIEAAGTAEPAK